MNKELKDYEVTQECPICKAAAEMYKSEPVKETEVIKPKPQRNELGYDHSSEDVEEAIGLSKEVIEDKIDTTLSNWDSNKSKISELVEVFETSFSTKALAVIAVEGVFEKIKNESQADPLTKLLKKVSIP